MGRGRGQQRTRGRAQKLVDRWNAMHPTGVPVRWVCRVWVGSRYHSKVDSKMAVRAFLSIHGEPMIEIFGDLPVAIDRVEPLVGEHPVVSEDREG